MELSGKKIIVTGGAGFIGSHLVDQLLETDVEEVVVLDTLVRGSLDNLSRALEDPRLHFHKADIRFMHEIAEFFEEAAGCFHLATLRITQCAEEPRKALEVMIDGTYNVLEACVERNLEKVVFSSSASVYGMADSFPTAERHHPWNNDTWYGTTKVCGEGMCRTFKTMFDLDYVALRYFNVYGPRMDVFGKYTEVLIRWMECFERGERPKIFGDGKQTMDFVYVEDLARCNIVAMESDVTDRVFNVARSEETSLLELLYALAGACGAGEVEPEFLPERAVNPVPRRLADVSAIEAALGFKAETSLPDGLRKLSNWYRAVIEESGARRR
jgi:UDP-glucose 4-epimerase